MSDGAIIGGVIGGVITVIGYFLVARWHREKEREDKALRTHFKDLKNEIMQPMISFIDKIKNVEGELVLDYQIAGSYIKFPQNIDFEKNELFKSFTAHFPEMARRWGELKGNIVAHNQALPLLLGEIRDRISQTTHIPFRNLGIVGIFDVPSIKENTPEYLWEHFLSRRCQDLPPALDFSEAKIEPWILHPWIGKGDTYEVYRLRCGDCVFALTLIQKDAEDIKDCFIALQKSREYVKKGTEILGNPKALEENCKGLKKDLNSTCEQYSKYKKLAKQIKDCPICKEVFN